ncbi:MAG: tRNA (adenosine(37)-N6)-threonylcarbamoyltransferase complex dimerization subunit type 1 TsaB [Eubacteriales bacterium]|nr:tRNA (adenosine(37)-N6)-threonylcarbamoyltransferase complex dimerization subunit type 1 TsaB [Eubacteriales bacterium]
MKLLAIDTSGRVATACIMAEDCILARIATDDKLTHSQSLMPMVDTLFRMTELSVADMDAVAIAQGPGSFTGLRIGAATAKGLASGVGIPVIGVCTLAGLAANLVTTDTICPVMDARRNQVYTATYRTENGILREIQPPRAVSVTRLIQSVPTDRPIIYTGDGVIPFRDTLRETPGVVRFAPIHRLKQDASSIAVLAAARYVPGMADDYTLDYLRKPQAEREREERMRYADQ